MGQNHIDILVGSDFYWSVVTGEIIRTENGPIVVSSKLGWLVSGPVEVYDSSGSTHSNLVVSSHDNSENPELQIDQIVDVLKKFWEIEGHGIEEQHGSCNEVFLRNVKFKNGRYEVGLPWIRDCCELSNHYQPCLNRLKLLQKKLLKNSDILDEYHYVIQDQLEKGIIERVSMQHPGKVNHYMPHHPVIRKERSTTKMRVVYDGSAKCSGSSLSLNDCLQTGPNLIPKLFDVLARFRLHRVALTADIEKAFLMVGINEADRDMLRFLWFSDPHSEDSEVIQLRFTRLVFGLRPSPAILGSVIAHHVRKYQTKHPELVECMNHSLYVDDLITGAASVKDAFSLYKVAKSLMLDGGFNLRKWNSNSTSLLSMINSGQCEAENRPQTTHSTVTNASALGESNKLLGILWHHESDEFKFSLGDLQVYARSLPFSKRAVLRITAGIFDPLGFLSPFVINLKIMFQKLCVTKSHWDDPLPSEQAQKWSKLIQEFDTLQNVTIPRCYFDTKGCPVSMQLHGFSDAAEHAYAAVLCLRTLYTDGSVTVRLVASKTKVSPLKRQTIPRLELLGALILARLSQSITISIPHITEHFFWVDSMTVLCWIQNDKIWKQYVQHRVDEIRKLSNAKSWRHCPGHVNPADLHSRGITASELVEQVSWWQGPAFLRESCSCWPNPETPKFNQEAKTEMVKNIPPITYSMLATSSQFICQSIEELINCDDYSDLNHLLRVTSYVIRFINRCRNQSEARGTCVLCSEMNNAELLWIKAVQYCSFGREIHYLVSLTSPRPILVNQFGLFLDEQQVLCCQGRLNNSSLCLQSKNPALLPCHHQVVKLIVTWACQKVKHSGVADTLTYLRERFWILKGRQLVRKIIRACVVCHKLEGSSYPMIPAPDLPYERVSDLPPFTHTGVDYAGPLYIAEKNGTMGKAYICLFTCASTRALHLVLTHDLGVDSFLLALRRFASRRGLPATLMSDNAKTFRASAKELIKISRSKEINHYLTNNRVTWSFIVEKAPWWGGYWERMVQGVKRCLRKTIGRSNLTYEQLQTLIVEVESVINAHPLTYVQDDTDGISYTLSPSHLIYGRKIADRPNDSHFDIVSTHATLTKRYKIQRHLLTQFTNQWRKDYLTGLRESHRNSCSSSKEPQISIDDVVVLKDDSTKRTFWKLAVVKELIPGRDDKIRAAWVKVASDDGSSHLLKRSTQHLYPVEVRSTDLNTDTV